MKIIEQTLIPYDINITTGHTELVDLKTLSILTFPSLVKAFEFCDTFGEDICKAQLREMYRSGGNNKNTFLYLETCNGKHKVVDISKYTSIEEWDNKGLLEHVRQNKVINAEMTNVKHRIMVKWIPTPTPKGFKEDIEKEYTKFMNFTGLMGTTIEFTYVILGTYVIMDSLYCHEKAIIPSFITSISCIDTYGIDEITLTEGTEFLGSHTLFTDKGIRIKGGEKIQYIGNMVTRNEEVIISKNNK